MRKKELKHVTTIVVLFLVLAAAVMAFVRAAPPPLRPDRAFEQEDRMLSPTWGRLPAIG